MKRTLAILVICALSRWAGAQVTTNYTLTPNVVINPGNPAGVMETFNVTGISGPVTNVDVSLNVSGGYNGSLYAYLTGPEGQSAILLNRVGVTGSNPAGYSDLGFNITLDDSGANIHDYQAGSYTLVGGQLTQVWAPDGRPIDPQSPGSAFDSASTGSDFSLFNNTDANGTWTFFIADLVNGGSVPDLQSVTLTIMTAPEPGTWALAVLGGLGLLTMSQARKRR